MKNNVARNILKQLGQATLIYIAFIPICVLISIFFLFML